MTTLINLWVLIPGAILIVFLIPWYCQQLGRFFSKGCLEFIFGDVDQRINIQLLNIEKEKEKKNG